MEQHKINAFVEAHTPWRQVDGGLTAMWSFESFDTICAQLPQLCQLFTDMNHHPVVTFGYNFIRIETTTHDAGNQVTEKDIALAGAISDLLDQA